MALHERQRYKQTEDMSDGAALTSINVRTARDKMTTKDSKHPNDDLKKRLGQVPDFTRLHKDFERKLSLCRDSNRSKLTVPQVSEKFQNFGRLVSARSSSFSLSLFTEVFVCMNF